MTIATVDTPDVGAALLGTLNGVPFSDSPLDPQNTRERIIARKGGGNRARIHDSFYFRLPNEWLVEGVELTAPLVPV